MAAHTRWSGEHLWNLLHLSWDEFSLKYPDVNKNTWKGKRGYWRKKIMSGETLSPQEPDRRLTKEWEVSAFNRETNEWETTMNHAYEPTRSTEDRVDDYFPQVESAVIKPTRRQRAKRLGEMCMTYGDGQVDFRILRDPRTLEQEVVPQHNLEMHRIILRMNAHYQPELTVNGGDFADFAGSSRFPADSDHHNGSMTMSLQWIHDFYGQMRADNPNATIVETGSNHADRPKKKVLAVAPEFYNFYRPGENYPAWTYYSMAKLGDFNIIHPTGWPNGEFIWGEEGYPQVLFKHGDKTGTNAIVQEANTNPTINIVRFHNHGERLLKRTTREGQQLFYLILGSACLNNAPVPGFHSSVDDLNRPVKYHNQDHVNSFAMLRNYGKGRFGVETIDVVDGKAYYDGIEWDGSEPFDWEYRYGYLKTEGGEDGNA